VITLAHTTFRAWSCTVRLAVCDEAALEPATQWLHSFLDSVDRAGSRLRDDSDLSRANRNAGRPTPVSGMLTDLVARALAAAAWTDGLVDPTLGACLVAAGYDRDISEVAPDGPAMPAPRAPDTSWREVYLNRDIGVLTVPAGAALDLGATAKAAAADLAADELHRRFGVPVLVELGGDLAVAGAPPGDWPLRVSEAEGGPGEAITLSHGGVATSTTTLRTWVRGGVRLHHIIDPRTGEPAEGPWRTVSVVAQTALMANAASTASIVLGAAARDWLIEHRFAARLVGTDGQVVHTPAWLDRTDRVA
jgi:thiamine biosynthesis lipoprotein